MTDKMREAFEKWAKAEYLDLDSVDGFYSDNDTHIAWGAWQAAQTAAVPVVGEPVAWGVTKRYEDNVWFISDSRFTAQYYAQMYAHRIGENPDQVVIPLYLKPTTSITAAELDALRKDAERYRWIRDANNDPGGVIDTIPHPGMALYRAESELDDAIDAAIAGEKK